MNLFYIIFEYCLSIFFCRDLKSEMDQLVAELKTKKAKIEYLNGFNKTAIEAIKAMEMDLVDQDKKLKGTDIESKMF